jgi:hypothetical protein
LQKVCSWKIASNGALDFGPTALYIRLGVNERELRVNESPLFVDHVKEPELTETVSLTNDRQVGSGGRHHFPLQQTNRFL